MTTILHSGDLHLGASVAAPDPEVAPLAAGARREALKRLVELAKAEKADLVVLAGDIFDSPEPPLSAVMQLQWAIEQWLANGARVAIAPGNHDPWLAGGLWAAWPASEGLAIFGPKASGLEMADLGLFLAGVAHDADWVGRDLSGLLPPPPAGLFGVGLLHATVTSAGAAHNHQHHAPVGLASLSAAGFGLWALGHIHLPQRLAERPAVVYAGAPQGGHLGEPGPRGAWLHRLSGSALQSRFVPLAPLLFHDLAPADLAGVADLSRLAGLLGRMLAADGANPMARSCLRLTLAGPSPLAAALKQEGEAALALALKEALGLAGLVLHAARLLPMVGEAELAGQGHVLAAALREMQAIVQDPAQWQALLKGLPGKPHPAGELAGGCLAPAEAMEPAKALALRRLWLGGEGEGR